jgi:hypothetical protein
MFNLDQAIQEWRRQMSAGGVKASAALDELESHLREDIAQQLRSGSKADEAFKIASERIGSPARLKTEFKNADIPLETRLVSLTGIACGTVAFLFSTWILFFLFYHGIDFTSRFLGLSAVAVAVLGWIYGHKFLPIVRNQRVRTAIGFICCLAGVAGMLIFVQNVLPHVILSQPAANVPPGRLLAVFLWGWMAMAVLGGVGRGLEKAVETRNVEAVA